MPEEHRPSILVKQHYFRTKAVWYLQKWLLTPYSWGGNDFSSQDCSGLMIEILKSVGVLPHAFDDTAQGLYLRFKQYKIDYLNAGYLVFWFKNGKAVHVEMGIDEYHVIGASGGGSATLTIADAAKNDAFVKMRPVSYRGSEYKTVDPFRSIEG